MEQLVKIYESGVDLYKRADRPACYTVGDVLKVFRGGLNLIATYFG